jgi:16S rRNA (cytosine1402-N4)-methyltransferase
VFSIEPEPERGAARHLPVMSGEVLELLRPRGEELAIDCTLGLGGHSEALLEREGFAGRVIGIDRDQEALRRAQERLERFGSRFTAVHGSFGRLGELLEGQGCAAADAILFDLGVSSMQLDEAARGFSFRSEGPLDMRMDPSRGPSAAEMISELDAEELARVFWEYGEERRSRRVAEWIVRARSRGPITTTAELAEIVRKALGGKRGRIDPATKTFQALRIVVNDELGELKRGLSAAAKALKPGGRLAVISFHSLEDRIVKHFLRDLAAEGAQLLTKRPLTASAGEVEGNPRARSAKLRAAIIGPGTESAA